MSGTGNEPRGPKIGQDGDGRNALLAALEQNWEHARYDETSRFQYFSLYWLAFAGTLVLVLQVKNGLFLEGLKVYWLLFLLLGIVGSTHSSPW